MLLGAVSLGMAACSSEAVLDAGLQQQEQQVTTEKDPVTITFNIGTPAPDGIVVRSAQTRADDDPVEVEPKEEDEEYESQINTLDIYMFLLDREGTTDRVDAPDNYYFYKRFRSAETSLAEEGGAKKCDVVVSYAVPGRTARFALIANHDAFDDLVALNEADGTATEGTTYTTLTDFLSKQAKAEITSGTTKADDLVGGVDNTTKSFPMTVLSKPLLISNTSKENVVTVELVRTVARIDIFNYTTNLTITGVSLTNVNPKSNLFYKYDKDNKDTKTNDWKRSINPADKGGSETTEPTRVELLPLQSYSDRIGTTGLSCVTTYAAKGSNAEEKKEAAIAANSFPAFYLYEQTVVGGTTDANSINQSSPKITIDYTVLYSDKTTIKKGSVNVYFKQKQPDGTTTEVDINVKRNFLYRITLGEGTNIDELGDDGVVPVVIEVDDWNNEYNISSQLTPTEDGSNNE